MIRVSDSVRDSSTGQVTRGTLAAFSLEIESEAAADLDSGEKHALAAVRHDATIATDDLAAREVADALGIPLTGSVGLLIRLVQRGTIDEDEADEIHQRWVDEGELSFPCG